MTPTEADSRLAAAQHRARGASDATYTGAVATADPGDVRDADNEASATALRAEFLALADGMQELDADTQTIGDAMDMVDAEAEVAEAARRVREAEIALDHANADLAAARAMPTDDPCDGCHDERAAAVAEATEAVEAAKAALARARAWLRETLESAADIAGKMRAGLKRRHGGLQEAHADAPVRGAEREFYET
jgi:hypothetical protein